MTRLKLTALSLPVILGALLLLNCSNLLDKLTGLGKEPSEPFVSTNRVVPLCDALPDPATIPASDNTAQEKASFLAGEVLYGDTANVVPTLVRFFLECGIGIRSSTTGAMLFASDLRGSTGYAMQDWEVASLGVLSAHELSMTMGDLAAVCAFPELSLDSASMLGFMYDGLDSMMLSSDSRLSLFANFINELSEQGPDYSSLCFQAAASARDGARVSQLQAALIMVRLAADYAGVVKDSILPALPKMAQVNGDCNFDDATGSIMDATALATTYGMGKVLDYLDGLGMESAGKYAKISGAVSAMLALVKYIASGAAFEVKLDNEGSEPLVRTKTTQPGSRTQLRANARYNIGNWSMLNCARIAFNAANLDFNLPNDGPVADAAVSWTYDIGSTGFGANVIENSIVQFYSLDGQSIAHQKTDRNGDARIGLEGAKQGHDLVEPTRPDGKSARIAVRIALNSQKWFSDLTAAIGTATAGPFAPVILAIEMLNRIPLQGRARTIPVTDWVEHETQ
jgi:hypothetical protein